MIRMSPLRVAWGVLRRLLQRLRPAASPQPAPPAPPAAPDARFVDAAGLAALDVYEEEGTFEQVRALEPVFEEAIHSLDGHPRVTDVRNFGLMGGIDLEPREGEPLVPIVRR